MEQQRGPAVEQRQPSDQEQPARRQHAPALVPGLTARVELIVTDADTAQAIGSGDVPVLGTPRVLALAEAATVAATTTQLPPGTTTVGVRMELTHKAATPIGRTVAAEARLTEVAGRRLTFEVTVTEVTPTEETPTEETVTEETATVAEGRIERTLVDRREFVERAFGPAS